MDDTPRASKRRRDIDAPDLGTPASSIKSASVADDVGSHHSGRLSPVKQLMQLEDFQDRPVVFCNFDDDVEEEPADARAMRAALERYADGIGILRYPEEPLLEGLTARDQRRLRYPWASDPARLALGYTPPLPEVAALVDEARTRDRGAAAGGEDEWNTSVQLPLLRLALKHSVHHARLGVHSVHVRSHSRAVPR